MNARALIPALLAAVALAGCSDPYAAEAPEPSTAQTSSAPPAAPEYSRTQINRQDQASEQQRQREQAAMDQRPLLDHLPLTVGDVEISVFGLGADDKTTIIAIDPGSSSEADALAVYRDALHAYGDSGHAYEPKVIR